MAKYIGETTEYDKKQEVERRKVKSWLKSVSAFANGSGGCLLFGIADDDTIIGLTDAKTDAEFISQKIKERIDPMPQIDLKIERVEDKELLILHVHGGEDTPYYYIGDSVLETFVRIGNESVVADSTEHKRLVLRGRNSSFDARPSDEMFEDYAFSKLRSRYYAWNGLSFDKNITVRLAWLTIREYLPMLRSVDGRRMSIAPKPCILHKMERQDKSWRKH